MSTRCKIVEEVLASERPRMSSSEDVDEVQDRGGSVGERATEDVVERGCRRCARSWRKCCIRKDVDERKIVEEVLYQDER